MKIPLYLALSVGALLLLISAVRRRNKGGIDRKIDIVAYSVIFAGFLFLFFTCIVEAIKGGPLV